MPASITPPRAVAREAQAVPDAEGVNLFHVIRYVEAALRHLCEEALEPTRCQDGQMAAGLDAHDAESVFLISGDEDGLARALDDGLPFRPELAFARQSYVKDMSAGRKSGTRWLSQDRCEPTPQMKTRLRGRAQ
jgi:hypothetical protein